MTSRKRAPVVESHLTLSKTDLIDVAFHVQMTETEETLKKEKEAIDREEEAISLAVQRALEKRIGAKCAIKRQYSSSWIIEANIRGLKFTARVDMDDPDDEDSNFTVIPKDLVTRRKRLSDRQARLQTDLQNLSHMRKNRNRFKHDCLARMLESTPEGQKILKKLKAMTFKVGQAPRLNI